MPGADSMPPWAWAFVALVVGGLVVLLWIRRQRQRAVEASDAAEREAFQAATSTDGSSLEPTVGFAEINADYQSRLDRWKDWSERVQNRLRELRARDYENMSPMIVLVHASNEERANLATILGVPPDTLPAAMMTVLRKAGSHSLGGLVGRQPASYERVVADAVVKIGAPRPEPGTTATMMEKTVIAVVFEKMLNQANPEQRAAIIADLARSQDGSIRTIGLAGSGLVAANLGGFALYTAASSVLAAVTGVIGVTLPFAVYTGMSTVLATVIGPVGWVALATWAAASLGKANYKKTIPAVIAIATARMRLIAERDQELHSLAEERAGLIQESHRLQRIYDFLIQMRKAGADYRVPVSKVPR